MANLKSKGMEGARFALQLLPCCTILCDIFDFFDRALCDMRNRWKTVQHPSASSTRFPSMLHRGHAGSGTSRSRLPHMHGKMHPAVHLCGDW